MNNLKVIEARVRKCFGERIILDKKMREHRWKYHKYIITLDDNNPFQPDQQVKIMSNEDFEDIRKMVKQLRDEKDELQKQLQEQKLLITSIENKKASKGIKTKIKTLIS